jgi:hypothetical protein
LAPNAAVRDQGHPYQGLVAIRAWKAQTKKKYNHTVAPFEVAHRDGKTVLKAELSGNFPGSPVTLGFRFVPEDGKIVSLGIRSSLPGIRRKTRARHRRHRGCR